MKILIIDSKTNRPVANTKIQLQIKGKDSGFLSLTTDGNGTLSLEEKYNGQQIAATGSQGAGANQSISASDGAKLFVTTTTGNSNTAGAGSKQKSNATNSQKATATTGSQGNSSK